MSRRSTTKDRSNREEFSSRDTYRLSVLDRWGIRPLFLPQNRIFPRITLVAGASFLLAGLFLLASPGFPPTFSGRYLHWLAFQGSVFLLLSLLFMLCAFGVIYWHNKLGQIADELKGHLILLQASMSAEVEVRLRRQLGYWNRSRALALSLGLSFVITAAVYVDRQEGYLQATVSSDPVAWPVFLYYFALANFFTGQGLAYLLSGIFFTFMLRDVHDNYVTKAGKANLRSIEILDRLENIYLLKGFFSVAVYTLYITLFAIIYIPGQRLSSWAGMLIIAFFFFIVLAYLVPWLVVFFLREQTRQAVVRELFKIEERAAQDGSEKSLDVREKIFGMWNACRGPNAAIHLAGAALPILTILAQLFFWVLAPGADTLVCDLFGEIKGFKCPRLR